MPAEMRIIETRDPIDAICDAVAALPATKERKLIALAGPPASGKTTLARNLAKALVTKGFAARSIPMDGFHLDNKILKTIGRLPEKGAPDTFDAHGFIHAMKRLKSEPSVVLPEFDRDRELAVAGAIQIEECDRIIVVEGNYLCFDRAPWDQLCPLWDLSIFLKVPRDELETRLVQRWLDQGFTAKDAQNRADIYDMANADLVAAARCETDLEIRQNSA